MPKKDKQLPEPSEEFKLTIRHAGSISIDCDLCGRTHFGNDEYALEEDLGKRGYQKLMKQHKRHPDKYVYHPDEDMVPWGNINGKQAVIDCQCHKLSEYEKFFLKNRHIIADYFTARAEKELKKAQTEKGLAKKVKDSVESIK